MNILDENYYVKHECTLDFLLAIRNPDKVAIAIDKNNNIMMMQHEYAAYVCDHVGELKYKFTHGSGWQPSLTISEESEIISSSVDRLTVHKFSEEGKLKSTIILPEGHKILELAFHHVICKIIVLTCVEKKILISFCASLKQEKWKPRRSFIRTLAMNGPPILGRIQTALLLFVREKKHHFHLKIQKNSYENLPDMQTCT